MRKGVLSAVIALILISLASLGGCNLQIESETEYYDFGGESLKVGIISDSQLTSDTLKFENNLKRAFSVLKARGVDMIIFAGDITDKSNAEAYDIFNECMASAYGDSPILMQAVMGNHDYWGNGSAENCRKIYEEKLGKSPWTHYVVNGYHFIGASPSSGSMDNGYGAMKKWMRAEIEKAIAEDPAKPVFVTTHNSAKDTVYGSDDWGDKGLYDVFKDYEQVVNISGHLHYSMLDERAIHQQDFTSITTQSVSYTEMEVGKENGSIPPDADVTPMGLIMEIDSEAVSIARVNFGADKGEFGKDEKQAWTLPIPLLKSGFTYTEARRDSNAAPEMTAENGESYENSGVTHLKFAAGRDDDFVHSYKLEWSNGKVQYYFSDFYNGIDDMDREVDLAVDMKKGTYSVKVYAVDSWGAVSGAYTFISNVKVG